MAEQRYKSRKILQKVKYIGERKNVILSVFIKTWFSTC